MVVREKGEKLNKGFSKGILRILDFIFLKVIDSHWWVDVKTREYGTKKTQGRDCHKGARGQHRERSQERPQRGQVRKESSGEVKQLQLL